jgi:hypothetical protein
METRKMYAEGRRSDNLKARDHFECLMLLYKNNTRIKIRPRHAEYNSFSWIHLAEDRNPVTGVCEQGNELV